MPSLSTKCNSIQIVRLYCHSPPHPSIPSHGCLRDEYLQPWRELFAGIALQEFEAMPPSAEVGGQGVILRRGCLCSNHPQSHSIPSHPIPWLPQTVKRMTFTCPRLSAIENDRRRGEKFPIFPERRSQISCTTHLYGAKPYCILDCVILIFSQVKPSKKKTLKC